MSDTASQGSPSAPTLVWASRHYSEYIVESFAKAEGPGPVLDHFYGEHYPAFQVPAVLLAEYERTQHEASVASRQLEDWICENVVWDGESVPSEGGAK